MKGKKFFWLNLIFYLANLVVVILAIAFWTENQFVKILLSLYLMLLTGFYSYIMRHPRNKD